MGGGRAGPGRIHIWYCTTGSLISQTSHLMRVHAPNTVCVWACFHQRAMGGSHHTSADRWTTTVPPKPRLQHTVTGLSGDRLRPVQVCHSVAQFRQIVRFTPNHYLSLYTLWFTFNINFLCLIILLFWHCQCIFSFQ